MGLDDDKALEDHRHRLALELEAAKAEQALFMERTLLTHRAVLDYAQIAIRSVILANGVTATAILAYLGEASGAPSRPGEALGLAAAIAAAGVAFGVCASICAYFAQWRHARTEFETGRAAKPGSSRARVLGIVSLLAGLAAFLASIGVAVVAYS